MRTAEFTVSVQESVGGWHAIIESKHFYAAARFSVNQVAAYAACHFAGIPAQCETALEIFKEYHFRLRHAPSEDRDVEVFNVVINDSFHRFHNAPVP